MVWFFSGPGAGETYVGPGGGGPGAVGCTVHGQSGVYVSHLIEILEGVFQQLTSDGESSWRSDSVSLGAISQGGWLWAEGGESSNDSWNRHGCVRIVEVGVGNGKEAGNWEDILECLHFERM
jgi:hypothetical protein